MKLAKMQLLRGTVQGLHLQQNQSFGPLQRSMYGGSSSLDSIGSMVYNISRLRHHLGIRCRCQEGLPRSARTNPSSPLQHSKTAEQELSYSDVKVNRSRSHICRVLSSDIENHALRSAIEAHALTQLPVDPSGYLHQYFEPDPPKNEEPEGPFRLPLAKLTALLRLRDNDKETDYYELLAVADYLERLGLDVYFRQEIKSILDRVFRIWTESTSSKAASLLGDLEIVSLAFYLLRSHEYDVQPSLFHLYRQEDGRFCKRPQQAAVGDDTVSADVVDLLNLLRASDLRFRRDVVLQDAYKFASTTLSNMMDARPLSKKTSAEIMHRLKYPWGINFRMVETRQTILNFQVESVTAKFSSGRLSSKVVSLMLSTASQLFTHYISVFQHEIEDLERWSKESGLEAVNVRPPSILLPFYLGLAYDMPQAKYTYTRGVWAKTWYLMILQDDFYEGVAAASMEEVLVFMDAFKKFDPSILGKLPQVERLKLMRLVYKAMYDATISWAKESSIWHGRDLLRTIIDTWMVRLEIYLNEKRWMEYNYRFTTDKYMEEYGKWSFAVETGAPLAYYSIPGWKPSNAFLETRPDMEALFALAKVGRFLNDAKTYQYEEVFDTGKAEYINLLMKEYPHLTEADAVELTVKCAQKSWEEFTEVILRSSIPHRQVKQIVLSCFRTTTLMYCHVDGLRSTDWLLAKLMDPLPNLTNEN